MDDDEPKSQKAYPLSASKMSKTPSWIMLGFLLGAAFVIALPPLKRKPPAEREPAKAAEPPKQPEPREPPLLTTIEAVFAEWGRHAVWSEDVTEVALWNNQDKEFTDFYEVRRSGGAFYFRTIPRLTRRIISRGKPMPECPLKFTETDEQYREWLTYNRTERAPEPRDLRPRPRSSSTDGVTPPRFEATAPNVAPPPFERIEPKVDAPGATPPEKR